MGEKAVKKGEPKSTQKIYAQNFLKKQALTNKYKGIEAKWESVKINLANVSTTAQMCDTMQQMNGIMGKTGDLINPNSIAKTVEEFARAQEKQNIMGEMIGDAMDADGDGDCDDIAADELIDNIDKNQKANTNQNVEA